MLKLKMRERPFPELSYASPHQPALTRWFIHSIEGLSGRDRFAALYDFWRVMWCRAASACSAARWS